MLNGSADSKETLNIMATLDVNLIIPTESTIGQARIAPDSEIIQVSINVQAEVLSPKKACREATKWLVMHAGHLLRADNPELVLSDQLQWRFDVVHTLPNLDKPGTGVANRIGHIYMNAMTGELNIPEAFTDNLRVAADAIVADRT